MGQPMSTVATGSSSRSKVTACPQMKRNTSTSSNVAKKRDQRKMFKPDPNVVSAVSAALTGRPVNPLATAASSQDVQDARPPKLQNVSSSSGSHSSGHASEPIATFTSSRARAPVFLNPGKASLQDAIAVTQSSETKTNAMTDLEMDKLAWIDFQAERLSEALKDDNILLYKKM